MVPRTDALATSGGTRQVGVLSPGAAALPHSSLAPDGPCSPPTPCSRGCVEVGGSEAPSASPCPASTSVCPLSPVPHTRALPRETMGTSSLRRTRGCFRAAQTALASK